MRQVNLCEKTVSLEKLNKTRKIMCRFQKAPVRLPKEFYRNTEFNPRTQTCFILGFFILPFRNIKTV